jgi:hypothetical protein
MSSGNKIYDYVLVLKPATNSAVFDTVSQLLLFFAFSVNAYAAIVSHSFDHRLLAGAAAIGIAAAWIYSRIERKPFRLGLFIAFAAWIFLHHQWLLALLYSLSGILENYAKRKQEIGLDEQGLVFNGLLQKKYPWSKVQHMILKDGIITIDLPGNRIIQQELEDEVPLKLEQEVNDFCRQHLYTNTRSAV